MFKSVKMRNFFMSIIMLIFVLVCSSCICASQKFGIPVSMPKLNIPKVLTEQDRVKLNNFLQQVQEHSKEVLAPLVKNARVALDADDAVLLTLLNAVYVLVFKVYTVVSDVLSTADREKLRKIVKEARDLVALLPVNLSRVEQLKLIEKFVKALQESIKDFAKNATSPLATAQQSLIQDALKTLGAVYEKLMVKRDMMHSNANIQPSVAGKSGKSVVHEAPQLKLSAPKIEQEASPAGGDFLADIRSRPQLRKAIVPEKAAASQPPSRSSSVRDDMLADIRARPQLRKVSIPHEATTPKLPSQPASPREDLLTQIQSRPTLKPVVASEKPKTKKDPSMMEVLQQQLDERRLKLVEEEVDEEEYDFS